MTDKEEIEKLRDALVAAEEALDDAQRDLSAAEARRDTLCTELTATKRALTASDIEVRTLKTRLGIPSIVQNGNARCHTCGASIVTAVDEWKVRFDEADARIQRLEKGIAEATDWKTRAETAEAGVRHLELRIGLADDDWGCTRCDTHDKAVCAAAGEMPEDALRDWLATEPFARISIFVAVARAELARREAHRGENR